MAFGRGLNNYYDNEKTGSKELEASMPPKGKGKGKGKGKKKGKEKKAPPPTFDAGDDIIDEMSKRFYTVQIVVGNYILLALYVVGYPFVMFAGLGRSAFSLSGQV